MTPSGDNNHPRCWCGQSPLLQCFRSSRFGLLRCPQCGCYRIDPPPLEQDSDAECFYTEYYASVTERVPHGRAGRTSRFWRVVDRVPCLESPGETVVDIGCGDGHLCSELRAAGWPSVVGIEVSRTRLQRARMRYSEIDFRVGPIELAGISAASVDLAVMDNVIEHVPNPAEMLRRLRWYLRARGRLVVITPNMRSGHFRLLGRRWTPELAPHCHIFLFTDMALQQLLTRAGLVVEAVGSFHLPLYPLRDWVGSFGSGGPREALWRAMQESGGVYGRLIRSGPMLYAVARPEPLDPAARNLASAQRRPGLTTGLPGSAA